MTSEPTASGSNRILKVRFPMNAISPLRHVALRLGVGALILFGILSAPLKLVAAEKTNPNVIIILTDDQGSVDAGCYGSHDLVTPGVDALAARGVRFTQFYSGAPVCSPSRAALLT